MTAAEDKHAAARTATQQDPRWAALVARDRAAEGRFFYSVRTTGVYCRPSCAARLARPENVRFHLTRAEAERAGFRPCKRCRPDQPLPVEERHAAAKVVEARRPIEVADGQRNPDGSRERSGSAPTTSSVSSRRPRAPRRLWRGAAS